MTIQPTPHNQLQWDHSKHLVPYHQAVTLMEQRVEAIYHHRASELIWLLEHPSLYTAGTSAQPSDLLDRQKLPVVTTGRGGQFTYHGPGQRIAYLMLDLRRRHRDVRLLIWQLEEWLIRTLAHFSIQGERRSGRIGIWVSSSSLSLPVGATESKIAAIGLSVRRWITYHGVALNVHPDLTYYEGIVPCGLSGYGVTSMRSLGCSATLAELDEVLMRCWHDNYS